MSVTYEAFWPLTQYIQIQKEVLETKKKDYAKQSRLKAFKDKQFNSELFNSDNFHL